MKRFLRGRLSSRRRRVAVVVSAVVLAAGAGIGGATAATLAGGASPPASGPPQILTAPDGLSPGGNGQAPRADAMAVPQASHTGAGWAEHPLWVKRQNSPTAASPQLTSTTPRGYSPALLRSYLHLTGTGKGQTVAVVDAFDNPYAAADLTTFSKQFGLPLPCAKGAKSGCLAFSSVSPFGTGGSDPGWALESDLDVQMVHAVAPDASIVLVLAHDSSFVGMTQAIDYAGGLGVSVISNSYGGAEFSGETAGDRHCALTSALCVFSAGDGGNPGDYPAYDPHVLAVGGTTLSLTPTGAVDFEAGWCCATGATGGGVSAYEPRPSYQDGANPYGHRAMPDVSFDADPLTGVPVYDTFGLPAGGLVQNGWFQVGGTSAGAPAWAGIVAAADQLRVKAKKAPLAGAGFQAQQLIYTMPHTAFRDITVGVDNATACNTPVEICRAGPGYDTVTGWGSPAPGIDVALAQAG